MKPSKSPPTKKLPVTAPPVHDAYLRVLFDNTNEHAICLLDSRGRILRWNHSAMQLLGYRESEALGMNFSAIFFAGKTQAEFAKRILASTLRKGRYTSEGINIRKNGSQFWARSFMTPVARDDKGQLFFVLITHDITKARMLEQKKNEFIGVASHELRSPIQTLSLYTELLGDRLALEANKENLHMLRDMQEQTTRLVTLIDDLLLVNKVDSDGMQLTRVDFDPVRVFRKIVQESKDLSVTHAISVTGVVGRLVSADKNRIIQVFVNLLTNAVKYSPGATSIQVRITHGSRKCTVAVRDFGAGISPADQRHIFSRFYRTKTSGGSNVTGVGLGLYIAKTIIKRHRERLWVKSAIGRGSTFSFTLPLAI